MCVLFALFSQTKVGIEFFVKSHIIFLILYFNEFYLEKKTHMANKFYDDALTRIIRLTLAGQDFFKLFNKSRTYGHCFSGTQNDALPVGTRQDLGRRPPSFLGWSSNDPRLSLDSLLPPPNISCPHARLIIIYCSNRQENSFILLN